MLSCILEYCINDWIVCSPEEERNTVQKIRVKIKDIMMKEKDIDNISTQYVRYILMNGQ